MATQLEIFNGALRILETGLISDVNDQTEVGRILRDTWNSKVKLAFESYTWNFAAARAQLQQVPAPLFGYQFAYSKPSDWVRTLQVNQTGMKHDFLSNWVDEDGKILADAEQLFMRYISRNKITAIGSWPATFSEYMNWELAEGSTKLNTAADVRRKIDTWLPKKQAIAQNFDSQNDPPPQRAAGRWASAHFGGRGWNGQGGGGEQGYM